MIDTNEIAKLDTVIGRLRKLAGTIGNEYAHLYIEDVVSEINAVTAASRHGLAPSEVELIKAGQFINAIKEYRTRTGSDLRTAKDACEKVRDMLGLKPAYLT